MQEPAAPAAARRNPLLLVHGILGQRHIYWNVFRRRLIRDGFRVHEVILPYYLMGDMRIAARYLGDKIDATLRGDDATQVDLVCHSAGGLVARYYLKYLDQGRKVGHLVTLGTPHLGTYFSYLLSFPFMEIVRQTRPGSHFLGELNGPGAIPPHIKVTSLWSPIDGVVLPAENGILPGAHNIRAGWTTHWGFLWRPDIYDLVKSLLMDGTTQTRLDGPATEGSEAEA